MIYLFNASLLLDIIGQHFGHQLFAILVALLVESVVLLVMAHGVQACVHGVHNGLGQGLVLRHVMPAVDQSLGRLLR